MRSLVEKWGVLIKTTGSNGRSTMLGPRRAQGQLSRDVTWRTQRPSPRCEYPQPEDAEHRVNPCFRAGFGGKISGLAGRRGTPTDLSRTLPPGDIMALERTLSIIKPDAVAKNVVGEIYARFEKAGLKIIAAKMKHLSRKEAEGFYAVHRERGFFNALVEFMISGPVMITALEGENAVLAHRDLMGATNPKEAKPGTIRADFAQSIDANAVHGSDSLENATNEIAYFFASTELCPR